MRNPPSIRAVDGCRSTFAALPFTTISCVCLSAGSGPAGRRPRRRSGAADPERCSTCEECSAASAIGSLEHTVEEVTGLQAQALSACSMRTILERLCGTKAWRPFRPISRQIRMRRLTEPEGIHRTYCPPCGTETLAVRDRRDGDPLCKSPVAGGRACRRERRDGDRIRAHRRQLGLFNVPGDQTLSIWLASSSATPAASPRWLALILKDRGRSPGTCRAAGCGAHRAASR